MATISKRVMVILYRKRLSESNLHLNPDLISNKDLNQGCRLCVASFLLLIKTSLCFVRVFEGAVEIFYVKLKRISFYSFRLWIFEEQQCHKLQNAVMAQNGGPQQKSQAGIIQVLDHQLEQLWVPVFMFWKTKSMKIFDKLIGAWGSVV